MANECYVYITLPERTDAVTAGRLVLSTSRTGVPTGEFVYARSYLARPERVEIDPTELLISTRTYTTVRLKGVFGALRDAAPDSWGRRVIERHAGIAELGEVDYLLHSPDDRAGALGFGLNPTPPAPVRRFNQTIDLARLKQLADALIESEKDGTARPAGSDAEQVEELMLIGTAMGGARPKAVVEDGEGLWIAKFARGDDRWNFPKVEHAMLRLAADCGIHSAVSRIDSVAGVDVLLVKRFDRHRVGDGDYQRSRMVSALTLLQADEMDRTRWSYILLADELRRIANRTQDRDLPELFRRMCFNALISNSDDHPRNHAVVAKGTDWMLSPAYDLIPAPAISTERRDLAMVCGDQGRYANRNNLLTQCGRFKLTREAAAAMIDRMTDQVRQSWCGTLRAAGVSERDCELLRPAFVYDGFSLDQAP